MNRLPPGPRIAAWSTLRYMVDVFQYYRQCTARFGDPFTVPTLYGTLVVTGTPEGVRSIFAAPPETFLVFGREAVQPLFGPTGLQITDGERHQRDRKLLMPPFHGSRMRAYGRLMMEITRESIRQREPGVPFRIQETTHSISLSVMLRAIFGVTDPERAARLRDAILETHHATNPILVLFRSVRRNFGGIGPWAKFRSALVKLEKIAFEQIANRRRDPPGEDILSLLLRDGQMNDSELRDEMLSLVTAGHETTAIASAWSMYWVHRDVAVRERLLAELDELGDDPDPDRIAAAPYLDAVCHETLRLHPIIPEVTRLLSRPFQIGDYTMDAGLGVAAVAALAHMRKETFPEPEKFRPERFLGVKFSPYEYFPFGGGARRCLGAAFAMYELKLVLATLLKDCRFRLVDDTEELPVRKNVAVAPKAGVRVVIEAWRNSGAAAAKMVS